MMPANTTATTYVVNIGAVGIVGSIQGLSIELMMLGAMAGVAVIAVQKVTTRASAVGSVLVSMLLAAALSPVLAHAAAREFNLDQGPTQIAFSVLLGASWPWVAPWIGGLLKEAGGVVIDWARKLLGVGRV